jgi:hypothetical protein
MKSNVVAFVRFGVLVIAVAVGFMIVRPALAQVDSSSTSADSAASTTTPDPSTATTSTDAAATMDTASDTTVGATTTTTDASATTLDSSSTPQSSHQTITPTEPPPTGLTEIHIIGTKYIDYFTDGTTTTEYPGDANIDSHLSEKDAPIPAHDGLKWDHTIGRFLYDTPSGDLEVGDYAAQPNGTYIGNAPPFVSSTSTEAVSGGTTPSAPTSDTASTSSPTLQSASSTTTDQGASSTPPATDTTATTTS